MSTKGVFISCRIWCSLIIFLYNESCTLLSASVEFSCSVVPDSLQPYRLQHTRLPLSIADSRSLLSACLHLIALLLPTICPFSFPALVDFISLNVLSSKLLRCFKKQLNLKRLLLSHVYRLLAHVYGL